MKYETLTQGAAIAAAVCTKRKITGVFSLSTDHGFVPIDAVRIGNSIKAFDHKRQAIIEGDLPSGIYNFSSGEFMELKEKIGGADGFCFGETEFFEVTVSGEDIEVCDLSDGNFYFFTASFA